MTDHPHLLGPTELADRLNVSRKTIHVWRQDPTFPRTLSCPTCGHRPLYDVAAVEVWRDARRRARAVLAAE